MTTSVSEVLNGLPLKQNSKILIVGDLPLPYISLLNDKTNNLTILKLNKNQKNNSFVKEIFYDADNGKIMPFKNSFYDVLLIFHSLRKFVYRESFLKDCKRILKNGGLFVVVESKPDSFGTSSHPDAKIIFDDMLEYLDNAGFLLGQNFDTNADEYGIISVCPLHNFDE